MDIADWLKGLGLAQYATAFRENDITEALLPDLTAEDLKDLGVATVGHRRTILKAIASLRSPLPAPPVPGLDRLDPGIAGRLGAALRSLSASSGADREAVPAMPDRPRSAPAGYRRRFHRAKERLVLSEAETSEPTPDIHGRTPPAPNRSLFG